jgi:hypothetical protein
VCSNSMIENLIENLKLSLTVTWMVRNKNKTL